MLSYKTFIKPLGDVAVSLIAFILAFPFFILIAILLFIVNNGKPFFFQLRPGLNGKIFKLIKFRTMNDKRGPDGNLLPDSKRLTGVGKFVRKTSLDEIPQFINVLIGDMSLIGPRPLLVGYLSLYNNFQKRRHDVKPGITGWAQINGRNTLSWEQKFEYDVWYVDHISVRLDLKILFLTFSKIFKSEGINAGSGITMEAFKGSD